MPDKRYGLITPDDGDEDVFFHESRVSEGWTPTVGAKVRIKK